MKLCSNKILSRSAIESKIKEVTSDDDSEIKFELILEIAGLTNEPTNATEILRLLWERLNGKNKKWRQLLKTLKFIEYLLKYGSEEVVLVYKQNIPIIDSLKEFWFIEGGKEVGENIRNIASYITNILRNDELLNAERVQQRPKLILSRRSTVHGDISKVKVLPDYCPISKIESKDNDTELRPQYQQNGLNHAYPHISNTNSIQFSIHNSQQIPKSVKDKKSDLSKIVKESTSNKSTGPNFEILNQLVTLTQNQSTCLDIFQTITDRLNGKNKKWLRIYKALYILEYLMKSGNENFVTLCRKNIFIFSSFLDYSHMDGGKDMGVIIREKANLLYSLLLDYQKLNAIRKENIKEKKRLSFSIPSNSFQSNTGLLPFQSSMGVPNNTFGQVLGLETSMQGLELSGSMPPVNDKTSTMSFDSLKQFYTLKSNRSNIQQKVKEATANDSCGPAFQLMSQIALRTNEPDCASLILQTIINRIDEKIKKWRQIYNSLHLMEYIIKAGHPNFAVQCSQFIHHIDGLREFCYTENGQDVGKMVREKATKICCMLRDNNLLESERLNTLQFANSQNLSSRDVEGHMKILPNVQTPAYNPIMMTQKDAVRTYPKQICRSNTFTSMSSNTNPYGVNEELKMKWELTPNKRANISELIGNYESPGHDGLYITTESERLTKGDKTKLL